ncbi:MAG: NAD(P)/FAD-dependent oxidoreductase, partial [Betaproteobacteria bacterium]
GMSTATFESLLPGGLVLNVNHLDGEIQGSGMDFATDLMTEVGSLGGENVSATVEALRPEGQGFVVSSDAGEHRAGALIVASGAKIRRLGIPGEAELEGQGVSQCADCDGPLFQGHDVVVVGGGDSALQEALALARYARRIHLLHRGAEFRARRHFVDAVRADPKISLRMHTVAEAVLGSQGVEAVRLKDGGEIACAGFFAFPGLEPVCGFVPAAAARDANGCLITDAARRTTIPGVYAAGAVRSGCGGLLSDAVADGVAAASAIRT